MESLDSVKIGAHDLSEKSIFKAIAATINNNFTDFAYAEFESKVLVIVTQFKKIGIFVSVEKWTSKGNDTEQFYDIVPLLGNNDNDLLVARFLAQVFETEKQILLSCSLKDYSPDTLNQVKKVFTDLIQN